MDQLFSQIMGSGAATATTRGGGLTAGFGTLPADWMPTVETVERDGKFIVRADLPGMSPTDVMIDVGDGFITLSGERREGREDDTGGVRRSERLYGRFVRTIALPPGARADEAQASYQNGVLEIDIPMQQQQQQQRRTIPIAGATGSASTSGTAAPAGSASSSGSTAGKSSTAQNK